MVFNYTRIVVLIVHTSGTLAEPVREYADWTTLEGETDYIPFNPATTLLELRLTEQATADVEYNIACNLYSAGSTSRAGYVEVYYYWQSGKLEHSMVSLDVEGVGNCDDYSVLQNQLADLVTVNMTSAHVFTINSAAEADFTSCIYYQDWVNLVNSGTVTRMKMYQGCTSSACAAVSSEYRLRYKSKQFNYY